MDVTADGAELVQYPRLAGSIRLAVASQRLFARTTRKFALTDDGRAYYEQCQEALAKIEDAEGAIGGRRAQRHFTGEFADNLCALSRAAQVACIHSPISRARSGDECFQPEYRRCRRMLRSGNTAWRAQRLRPGRLCLPDGRETWSLRFPCRSEPSSHKPREQRPPQNNRDNGIPSRSPCREW